MNIFSSHLFHSSKNHSIFLRSVERLPPGEPGDEVERPLGLVVGDHVAGVAHQDLREVANALGVAGEGTVDMPEIVK